MSVGKHKLNLNPQFHCLFNTSYRLPSASYGLGSLKFKDIFYLPVNKIYFKDDLTGIKLHSQQLSLDAEYYHEDLLNFIAAFKKTYFSKLSENK